MIGFLYSPQKRPASTGKVFYQMDNVGKARYTLNAHNGVDTHEDGSPFFGIELFKNKKKLLARKKALVALGYREI